MRKRFGKFSGGHQAQLQCKKAQQWNLQKSDGIEAVAPYYRFFQSIHHFG